MFGRYGEVDPDLPAFTYGVHHAFGQMFFGGFAGLDRVFMERNKPFAQGPVSQSFSREDFADDVGIIPVRQPFFDIVACRGIHVRQFVEERETADVFEKRLDAAQFPLGDEIFERQARGRKFLYENE